MRKVKNLDVYKGMLIVVDMVNGFVKEGVLHDDTIASVIPRQIELIKEAMARDELVVFIRDTHEVGSEEFKRFGNSKHCIKGTSEAELVDELKPFENDDNSVSIEKNSTSFMEAAEFRTLISEVLNVEKIDVVGCCTDICVANGTIGLSNYLNEHNRDVEVNVHADAVATYAEDTRSAYVEAAFLLMEQQGVNIKKDGKVLVKKN